MMDKNMLEELHIEIQAIKARNTRVEADKAWEKSLFRTSTISILTYLIILLLMLIIGVEQPYLAAIVPTAGFILSTLSLGIIKEYWIRNFYL